LDMTHSGAWRAPNTSRDAATFSRCRPGCANPARCSLPCVHGCRAEVEAQPPEAIPALLQLLLASVGIVLGLDLALAQLKHQRGQFGDAGLDARAGVVIEVIALEQALQLFHRIERPARIVAGIRVRLAGAHVVAGLVAGPCI